ncbi:putative endopeptidase p60 precursor [Prochlorococcus marinus str. MIT 1313]|uniref:C40 family peptidase n=1 Tax=Prochlorococcus TaxID=1218 RepID=UPI0007B3CFFF|nr:C40 family peptidase [Prochlorococcus marinus]KZR68375.1 putative endopeptidase p60 precursor [Prochlorococcus marinus str. MIT 1313]KZR71387.1 putative endopeptidase p60 precursor [Prochlorococcus marinus str. MIT 1318]
MPTLGTPITTDLLAPGSCWQLQKGVNGYAGVEGAGLATQAAAGRSFEVLDAAKPNKYQQPLTRLRVRLLEDGYPCWIDLREVNGQIIQRGSWRPQLLAIREIQQRLAAVMTWVEAAANQPNTYLWGGSIGPDFDCSGLVQTAFASQGIWLPRDAYQQESFCTPITVQPDNTKQLRPGDLIFFGSRKRCSHVGVYGGNGSYWHSSGKEHGRNGIGFDRLPAKDTHPVACYYRAELRGAGRVERCHDGTTLP